jgi:ATP-dependent helicase/nuclease subunit B
MTGPARSRGAPNVFTIAPGTPFLSAFVAAFLAGEVVEGFSAADWRAMPDTTVYVPTRRAARALAAEIARQLDRPAVLLPRILPLGALEATETSLLFEQGDLDSEDGGRVPPAITEIGRRMVLAKLILSWAEALRHAVVSVGPDGGYVTDPREACLVGTSGADAWHLAGELGGLIDEMIIEDVAWTRIETLGGDFDEYWRITLGFLAIAITAWPDILAQRGLTDAAQRQVMLVEAASRRLRAGAEKGAVVAIGSTGTNRATARLLAAIARAPNGAVVLPGLDLALDDASFAKIGPGEGDGEPAHGHPQAALARLLPILGVERRHVVALGVVEGAQAARDRLVAEALRPADSTDLWQAYRAAHGVEELASALAGVGLIEAADEREEALALAVALREVLETPGATAALVTPDRALAQRVRSELLRWEIEIDDTAGTPLSASPHGLLARHILACVAGAFGPEDVVALLTHPLTGLGGPRAPIAALAPVVEIGVLRAGVAVQGSPAAIVAAAQARRAHPAQHRIDAAEWAGAEALIRALQAALSPLTTLAGRHPLPVWVAAHRAGLDAVAVADGGTDRDALEALFDALLESPADAAAIGFDVAGYAAFFSQVAGDIAWQAVGRTHPRLRILGLLEARLLSVDAILLGGLDETIWPPQARTDAFLNRPMRAELGLTPPERRIGQTAHDFAQAMGQPRVVMSRALKRGGAPTVASRFVQRLAALSGTAWDAVVARGARYVSLARAVDRPAAPAPPARRPEPRPPLALRPARLSVTRIETLRRDPYAIYAEHCLRLKPLAPLGGADAAREIGSLIHEVLEDFVRRHPRGPLPASAPDALHAMLESAFAAHRQDPAFASFRWPRILKAADYILGFEARHRTLAAFIEVEQNGAIDIPLQDGSVFTLSAIADRIERRHDGSVALVDYKTGTPPGIEEVYVGFAPQLTLEAAMAVRGAFGLPLGTTVVEASYVKLLARDGGEERPLVFKKQGTPLAAVAETHYAELVDLLNQFRNPATAYPPRPFPKHASRFGDYDHLARTKAWALDGFAEAEE